MNNRQSKILAENNLYLLMNTSLLFFLPLLSILFAHIFYEEPIGTQLIGKWFLFWAAGIRLFVAGIKQVSDPAFTGEQIFKLTNAESNIIIRELGFANVSLGVMCILSLINDEWRILASIGGGIFFGFAALLHMARKPAHKNEKLALIYDAIVFAGMVAYIVSLMLQEQLFSKLN